MDLALRQLMELLSRRTGLCLCTDRNPALADVVHRAMKRVGARNLNEFRARIELDQAAFDDLLAEITIGETYFYREPEQFRSLSGTIIPEIQSRKGFEHVIRFWSAGCSSGEEAWSLAMLCEQSGLRDRYDILATDISRESLRKAERGVYRNWSLRGPSQEFTGAHLRESPDGWHIHDSLRKHVVFDYLNLALDNYPSLATGTWGTDIILCRNVLIYFDERTVEAVVRRLYDSLSPGGWLILASTDPPAARMAPFDLVDAGPSMVYRRPGSPQLTTAVEHPPEPKGEWIFDEPESGPVESTIIRSGDVSILEAQEALRQGEFERVRGLTENREGSPVASALLIRALAGQDTTKAERACAAAADRHAASEELHYLHAVLLLDLKRYDEALHAARRALFLDRKLAIAHFTLGVIQQRSGNRDGSIRAFRNARQICDLQPAQSIIPFSDGEHAGRLSQMAAQHLAMLDADANPA